MENNLENFIQTNSPDGGFLQSSEWRKFQESVGRRVFVVPSPPAPLPSTGEGGFYASIIEHALPLVDKYFYVPRGPVMEVQSAKCKVQNYSSKLKVFLSDLINLAKKNKIGWIRIDPATEESLEIIRNEVKINGNKLKVVRAPHDVQPKEIFVIDIAKSEEELLAEMKSKTRYNIKLAEKKGVKIFNFQFSIFNKCSSSNDQITKNNSDKAKSQKLKAKSYLDEFLRLVKVTAERDGIVSHPENYYRKMFEVIPEEILKLYVAEYKGQVIAANLVLFYGDTCTYMHGASDNEHRNVMAPYLLQWKQIQDAKAAGCKRYDFGGVRTTPPQPSPDYKGGGGSSWFGITRFKTGFSPKTVATIFPGSYDIIINSKVYWLYRIIQKIKSFVK